MKSVIAALLVAACGIHPAVAQGVKCYDTVEFKKRMVNDGNERIFSGLVTDQSHILEIWVSQTGEWAAFITTPENKTCVASAGQHYVGPLPNA